MRLEDEVGCMKVLYALRNAVQNHRGPEMILGHTMAEMSWSPDGMVEYEATVTTRRTDPVVQRALGRFGGKA